MKIILKGFGNKPEPISSNYRVNSESLNWNVVGFNEAKKDRDKELLKALWNLYLNDETAFAVVQGIAMITLGEKFKIEGLSEDKKTEFEDLTRAFTRTWTSLYGIVRDTLIFGNSFSKIIKNKAGTFHSLKVLYPLDVTKKIDDDKITYTYQDHDYNENEIFENSFFLRPDSLYGIPLLGPSKRAIDRKRVMESNIATAIERHMPRFSISVSPDSMGRYPSEEERREIGKEFKKLASDQEFVHTNLIDINVIDTKSTIPELEDYMMFSLNSILIGSLCPPEIVGAITKSGSFATAKSRANIFLTYTISYFQRALESNINDKILKDSDATVNILPPSSLALEYSK